MLETIIVSAVFLVTKETIDTTAAKVQMTRPIFAN